MPLHIDTVKRKFADGMSLHMNLDVALKHAVQLAYDTGLNDASRLDTARLLHQFRELAKAADKAILILNTVAATDDDEHDIVDIKRVIDALETWSTEGLLFKPEKVGAGETAKVQS